MSKIGVGVGEEFPVDEQGRVDDSERCCGGGTHEARREAWRQFRHQMHAKWHARRAAMRERFGHRDHDGFELLRDRHVQHLIIGGLAVIGLAALLGAMRHRD